MNTSIVVLIVDDEEAIRLVLEEVLTEGGYAVRFASNAEEAMSLLDDAEACIRALITDVNLSPGKQTGWDVARHAREVTDNLPVVYITGASAHEWSVYGVPKSVLLSKPFAPAQIVTAVSHLLNSRLASAAD